MLRRLVATWRRWRRRRGRPIAGQLSTQLPQPQQRFVWDPLLDDRCRCCCMLIVDDQVPPWPEDPARRDWWAQEMGLGCWTVRARTASAVQLRLGG